MKVAPFDLSTEEIRDELASLRNDFSIAVCRAKNPFNIGAIIRVAHSFLVREIFLIGTEPYYERAAMGMQKYETIVEVPDEASFLEAVRGRPLLGVERDHAQTTIWEAEMPKDLVFLFGSENEGIPPVLLEACDLIVAIPMYGINHSYPVAIAAGMVMCEWARRKDPRGR
ncbi:MAG: TrmH family RNA methyltransferase [Polyangiaceae bacterium]|nr:TrmH family RNA methyltransferase [Polyangiaceae bacterium]NUQ76651.1 TrmH family RNA methyltransferase [Polyangiaceae bacterium]